MFICLKCGCKFSDSEHYDCAGEPFEGIPKLCYHCFEESVEEYEIKRRERIARDNEY